jgi:AcrR family transcriptional regulator
VTDAADVSPAEGLRARAVSRSLDEARVRAEERVQRFLDAAGELIVEHDGLDFTVQDVVERSGQSLRSFYQFFDGKQHLLLAVYEESIAGSAARLREHVDAVDDPLERLRTFVVTLYLWSDRDPVEEVPAPHRAVRAMAAFVFELMATDPARVAGATTPLFDHATELMEPLVAAGAVRFPNPRRAAALVLQTTMFNAFGAPAGGAPGAHRERADELWEFCLHGIAAD